MHFNWSISEFYQKWSVFSSEIKNQLASLVWSVFVRGESSLPGITWQASLVVWSSSSLWCSSVQVGGTGPKAATFRSDRSSFQVTNIRGRLFGRMSWPKRHSRVQIQQTETRASRLLAQRWAHSRATTCFLSCEWPTFSLTLSLVVRRATWRRTGPTSASGNSRLVNHPEWPVSLW